MFSFLPSHHNDNGATSWSSSDLTANNEAEIFLRSPNEKIPTSKVSRSLSLRFIIFILTFIVLGLAAIRYYPFAGKTEVTRKPETKTLSCGDSAAEARKMNCVYDPLSVAWVPKPCLDTVSLQEYYDNGNWTWYDDKSGLAELDFETMSERAAPSLYYTTMREHLVHCAINWRRFHRFYERSRRDRVWLNSSIEYVKYEHTEHCSAMLIDYMDNGDLSKLTRLRTGNIIRFETCTVAA